MKKASIIVTFFVLLKCSSIYAQMTTEGLLVNPSALEFRLLNGQAGVSNLSIINNLKEKKQIKLFVADWLRDTTGRHVYLKPGTISHSCSNWISLDKDFVELEPGQAINIEVKLKVPDSADNVKIMRWGMVFVETIAEKTTQVNPGRVTTTITTNMRIGVHVYQTPPNLDNAEIKMLSFDPKPNAGDSIYRIVCQNTGAVQLQCKSYLELSSMEDGKKIRLNNDDFPMFPEQKRYIDYKIPGNVPKGKYNVLAVVDAGEDLPLEAAQAVIEVK